MIGKIYKPKILLYIFEWLCLIFLLIIISNVIIDFFILPYKILFVLKCFHIYYLMKIGNVIDK